MDWCLSVEYLYIILFYKSNLYSMVLNNTIIWISGKDKHY